MSNIQIKTISTKNITQLHMLILEENQSDMVKTLGFIPTPIEVQRQTFNDPDYDPDLLLGAFINEELAGCIMGIRRPWKEDPKNTGFIKFILVHKSYRRGSIGRMLLEACESKLKELGSNILLYGSSSPLYLFPGVPKENSDISSLLETCGWKNQSERISLFTNLKETNFTRNDLDAALEKNRSLHIYIATNEDEKEIVAFVEHEFTPSWAKEAQAAINTPLKAFCSVIRDKNTREVYAFAAVNGTNPNWFGPMGVRSDLQKQGLGHLLVYHTFLTAQQKGMTHLVIPWINGKETFYSKFVTRPQWQIYCKFEKQI